MVRLFGYHTSKVDVHLVAWTFVVCFLSFSLPAFAELAGSDLGSSDAATAAYPNILLIVLLIALLFSGLLATAMFAFGLDSRGLESEGDVFFVRLSLAFLTAGVILAIGFYSFPLPFASSALLPTSLAFAFAGILLSRGVFKRIVRTRAGARRVIVVGSGRKALEISKLLNGSSGRYRVVGFYGQSDPNSALEENRCDAENRSLVDFAVDASADEIIVAVNDGRGEMPVDALLEAKLSGIRVTDLLTFYERECSMIKCEYLRPSWIVFSSDFQLGVGKRLAKRAFDLVMALILLFLTAPIMILLTAASLIESRGRDPVLYFQRRVGYGGRIFRLYKFRSMLVSAERDGMARWASTNDCRITALGRFMRRYRLDELPQLFNILMGDMSLVGPRPERPEFVSRLSESIPFYIERHCVKPGLAGWAQLMYPYGSSIEDAKRKLEYDIYYVKHASIVMDLIVLLRTVEVVLLGKGAR